MASEPGFPGLGSAAANPWLWAGLAAFFLGLALGQLLGALLRQQPGRAGLAARTGRPRSWKGASVRALLLASLALLAVTALLVLPAPASLSWSGLLAWSGLALALGGLAGLLPLPVGLPLIALALASGLALRSGLSGWTAWEGPGPLARLLPIEVANAGRPGSLVRAELELVAGRGPGLIELSFDSAGLAVEALEFRGPLSALALLSRLDRPPSDSAEVARFYRVAGLVGPAQSVELPLPGGWPLSILARLGPQEGLAPGARSEKASLGGLVMRRRAASALRALEPLLSLSFSIDANLVPGP